MQTAWCSLHCVLAQSLIIHSTPNSLHWKWGGERLLDLFFLPPEWRDTVINVSIVHKAIFFSTIISLNAYRIKQLLVMTIYRLCLCIYCSDSQEYLQTSQNEAASRKNQTEEPPAGRGKFSILIIYFTIFSGIYLPIFVVF